MTTEPNAETVDRVAKAINGPHDATHIGKEKLMELQEYGWKNYTDKNDRETLRIEARAAIAAMADREVTVQEAARILADDVGFIMDLGMWLDKNGGKRWGQVWASNMVKLGLRALSGDKP